jgi:hypothetical protein
MNRLTLNPDTGRYGCSAGSGSFPKLVLTVDAQAVEAALAEHPAEEVLSPDFWRNCVEQEVVREELR